MAQTILLDTNVVGRSQPFAVPGGNPVRSIQVSVAAQSWCGVTVKLYGCNDIRYPVEILTVTINASANQDTEVVEDNSQFAFYYAEVTAIYGTQARASVVMSGRGTPITPVTLIRDVTSAQTGPMTNVPTIQDRADNIRSFHATVTRSFGPVSAVVEIYGCNDARFPVLIGTIRLDSTGTQATDWMMDDTPFEFYQAKVVNMVGSGGVVSVVAGF